MKNNKIDFCTQEEIKEMFESKERLVFIDDSIDEVIGKFNDLPDIIVDFNRKLGFRNLRIFDFINPTEQPIITTQGIYLDKISPEDRSLLIDRLTKLQLHREKVKTYKVINEEDLGIYFDSLEGVKEMKESVKSEKQRIDEELDLLYKKGLITIDELDDMQRHKSYTKENNIHENR